MKNSRKLLFVLFIITMAIKVSRGDDIANIQYFLNGFFNQDKLP